MTVKTPHLLVLVQKSVGRKRLSLSSLVADVVVEGHGGHLGGVNGGCFVGVLGPRPFRGLHVAEGQQLAARGEEPQVVHLLGTGHGLQHRALHTPRVSQCTATSVSSTDYGSVNARPRLSAQHTAGQSVHGHVCQLNTLRVRALPTS